MDGFEMIWTCYREDHLRGTPPIEVRGTHELRARTEVRVSDCNRQKLRDRIMTTCTGSQASATKPSGGGSRRALRFVALQVLSCVALPLVLSAAPTINYVQGNYATPQASQTTVSVKFNAVQIAGDLNVVAVGWNDSTATVSGVTDTAGNAYTLAVGPTVISGVATQSIYYAKNIVAAAAGANTVTVTFSPGARYPDIRILEYSGADPANPVDVTAAGSGNSATSNSGSATTTNTTDLLFAANLVQSTTTGAGSGFTSRLLTAPDSDIAEDRMVTATGSYSATAPLSSAPWIMQMVAFRTPVSGGDIQPPTAPTNLAATAAGSGSQINLSWTTSIDNVGVTQYLVERCQGAGCSTFAQIGTATGTTYNDTGLTPNTNYSYRVRATDAAGNLSPYSNVASATTASSTATINYVQGNYATPQASQTTVSVKFNAVQIAGDLNVVAVGWNDSTATVSGVTDTAGNAYTLAVGPTVISGVATQSIYYAKNIVAAAAGANTVTVTFSPGARYPDIRILEYSGADPANPVDVTAAGSGNSATSSSGSATTTNTTDLLFAANLVQSTTTGAGSGFTSRLLTAPDSDIAEDRMVTATGSYSATAPLSSAPWIMQMVAFRTPVSGGDIQPPTAPTNLAATAAGSGSQINLSWTASIDNVGVTQYLVERCQGAGCSNFAQIGTSTGTTYNDTGLTLGTSYSYRVRATDAAGNLSPYSNVASATTQNSDTQPPTAPSNLVATAVSGSQINLSWTASTDNVGVTGYLVERCQGAACSNFAQIGTSTGTTYSDTGLTSATSYTYQVRATDSAGNLSPYSNIATATTQGTIPGLVAAYSFDEGTGTTVADASGTGNTGTIANAIWTSTGKYGKALVFNGMNSWVTIPDAPSLDLTTGETLEAWVYPFTIPPLNCSSTNCSWMDVIHKDSDRYYIEASSNQSQEPETGGIFASGKHIVFGPSILPVNAWTHLALTYDSTTIRFYVNGALVASSLESSEITTSTNPLFIGGDQTMGQFFNGLIDEVRVYQIALSQAQIQADMNTPVGYPSPDTQSPTAPTNLAATAAGSGSQINLSWTASIDNVGVTQYLVERCQGAGCSTFAQIGTATGTTYNDTGLTPNTNYSYRVRATDAAGNLSPYSNVASATTASSTATINYVQGNYATPQASQTTVSVKFNAAQIAGDLNVVVVGWNDSTATVSAVTDTAGNAYTLAVGPTVISGVASAIHLLREEHRSGGCRCQHRYRNVLHGGCATPTFGFWSTVARIRPIPWM